jgi:hypothetical protein
MRTVALGAAFAFALMWSPASHAELVTNGGFETGDFTGWAQSGNTGFMDVDTDTLDAHSGTYGASFGPVGSLGYISQTLATTAGGHYELSFWLDNQSGPTNAFEVSWNGTVLHSLTDSDRFDFTRFSFAVDAVDSSSVLQFGFQQNPSYWGLDDVSVVASSRAVPEPATLAVLGTGVLGFGLLRRRRRA